MSQAPKGQARAKARSRARRLAMQAIYQWQMTGQNVSDIERQFLDEQELGDADVDYFKELLHGVPAHLDTLDAALAPALSRGIEAVDPVEQAILRLGAYEFAHHPEIPYRVVINEAVELAKTFGAEQGHRFINGVMDRLARDLRKVEVEASRK